MSCSTHPPPLYLTESGVWDSNLIRQTMWVSVMNRSERICRLLMVRLPVGVGPSHTAGLAGLPAGVRPGVFV